MKNNVLELTCESCTKLDEDKLAAAKREHLPEPAVGHHNATCEWPDGDHMPQEAIDGWYEWAKEHKDCEVHIAIRIQQFAGVEDPR